MYMYIHNRGMCVFFEIFATTISVLLEGGHLPILFAVEFGSEAIWQLLHVKHNRLSVVGIAFI